MSSTRRSITSAAIFCSARTRPPTMPPTPRSTPIDQAVALVGLDVAQIAQKAAALKAAQINLDYTNIVSPVDGTVVSRNITAGQTVAASFQTPTLFLIATDLTKMQVDTNVSESDIAGAVEGANASFTVDAFPKPHVPGTRGPGPAGARQRAERDHLRCGDHGRQSRPAAQAGDDGDRQNRHGPIAERAQSPIAGAAIYAGRCGQAGRPSRAAGQRVVWVDAGRQAGRRFPSRSGSTTTPSPRSSRAICKLGDQVVTLRGCGGRQHAEDGDRPFAEIVEAAA